MTPALAVFLKAPRLGTVKTRLAAEIGDAARAPALPGHGGRTLAAAREAGLEPTIWFTPADAGIEMRAWLGDEWDLRPQASGDLGARLAAAERAVESGPRLDGHRRRLSRLDAALLRDAVTFVARGEIVLGPEPRTAGYYLIGGRTPLPDVFTAIPWSTARGPRGDPRATDARRRCLARAADAARCGYRGGRARRRTLDLIPGRGPYWPTRSHVCLEFVDGLESRRARRPAVECLAGRRTARELTEWTLVFSFRAAEPDSGPSGRPIRSSSSSKAALFAQAERIPDDALTALLAEQLQ